LIQDFLMHLQHNCGFEEAEPMTVLRHLAANKRIGLDLDRQFSGKERVEALRLIDRESMVRRTA
jgi:hypothetical protein